MRTHFSPLAQHPKSKHATPKNGIPGRIPPSLNLECDEVLAHSPHKQQLAQPKRLEINLMCDEVLTGIKNESAGLSLEQVYARTQKMLDVYQK